MLVFIELILLLILLYISMKEDNVQGDLLYTPSKYSKALNLYTKTQIKVVMPFLTSIAKTCDYSAQYPVCKVLKAISKLFLLNEIQVIFLAYLIRETKWDIKDKTIYSNAEHVQDIVCYSIESLEYKRLILYLMVIAYTVKYTLNEHSNQSFEEANKRCPNFKTIFQVWNKKHESLTNKINPRTFNTVYKTLYTSIRKERPDFNMMVDSILQISPAYNPQREKNVTTHKEQRKKNSTYKNIHPPIQPSPQGQEQKKEEIVGKEEKSQFAPTPPLFSSSGIYGLMQLSNQDVQRREQSSGFNPFQTVKNEGNCLQCQGLLGSSVYVGLQSNYDLQDDDCEELNFGLQEGRSEENIFFQQPEASIAPETNTVHNRCYNEKYLNLDEDFHQQ